jgi:type IX secretion system PorP/SprF family membrane protein
MKIINELLNRLKTRNKSKDFTKLNLLLILLFMGQTGLSAQDVLFTNYLNTPLFTNPALLAIDNDLKIGLNFRGRTSKFNQSYSVPVFSAVSPLINHEKLKRWGGIGFSFISEISNNSASIKTTGANLAFAYNIQINKKQFLSTSLGAGYFRRGLNFQNLSTGSQYVANLGFDPNLPTNESFINDTKGYLDLSTGIIWNHIGESGNQKAYFGFSAFHINQPNISMNGIDDELPIRYGIQAGIQVFDNQKISLFPDAAMDYQAGLFRYNVGLQVKVPFKENFQGYFRNAEICFTPRYLSQNIISLGIELRKPDYIILFAYDFSVANKIVNPNFANAYEIGITYKKDLFKNKGAKEKIIPDEDYLVGNERKFKKDPEVIIIKENSTDNDSIKKFEKEFGLKLTDPERRITFNYKSDKIDTEAQKILDEITVLMKSSEDYKLHIEGHTDDIGDAKNNTDRSLRRAVGIKKYFVKQGILPGRIIVSGMGESKPIATNDTEEGRAKNRRVEFMLYRVIKVKND